MQKLVARWPQCVELLTVQYRMNRDIMAFPSRWFYGGKLQAAPEAADRMVSPLDTPLLWLDSYGQLAGTVLGDISEAYVNAQFSQSQESKADNFGFQFSVDQGHDPYGMCRSLEKLNSLSSGAQSSALAKMFSSHPDSAKRAEKMRKKADQYVQKAQEATD